MAVTPRNRIRARAAKVLLSERLRRFRRRWYRGLHPGRRRLTFVYAVDEPYASLVLQVLPGLAAGWDVDVDVRLVGPMGPDVDPEPELRAAYAIADAERLAGAHGLAFDRRVYDASAAPRRREAERIIAAVAPAERLAVAVRIDAALRGGDALPDLPALGVAETAEVLRGDAARVRKAGHYAAAMIHDGVEWYWGLDRLPYLAENLAWDRRRAAPALPAAPAPGWAPPVDPERVERDAQGRPVVDFFFSFRSPYSYLAAQTVFEPIRQAGGVVRIRPVLPMVMRGLPVPAAKRFYILRDVKREAQRLGLPFGHGVDPLGAGVERCMAVAFAAIRQGRGEAFVASASRGIFSEAAEVACDADLRRVARRAGIDWGAVQVALWDDGWRAAADANRAALFDAGVWGVPSFVLGDLVLWGRDRVDALVAALEALPTERAHSTGDSGDGATP